LAAGALRRDRREWNHCGYPLARILAHITQMLVWPNAVSKQCEGLDYRPVAHKRLPQLRGKPLGLSPVAEHEPVKGKCAQCAPMGRVAGERLLPGLGRLFETAQIRQCLPAI